VNRRVAVDRHTGSARPASSNRHFSRVRPRRVSACCSRSPSRARRRERQQLGTQPFTDAIKRIRLTVGSFA
jgi:hypothetical protein